MTTTNDTSCAPLLTPKPTSNSVFTKSRYLRVLSGCYERLQGCHWLLYSIPHAMRALKSWRLTSSWTLTVSARHAPCYPTTAGRLKPLSDFSTYLLRLEEKRNKICLMNIYVHLENDPKVTKIIVSRGDRLQWLPRATFITRWRHW